MLLVEAVVTRIKILIGREIVLIVVAWLIVSSEILGLLWFKSI